MLASTSFGKTFQTAFYSKWEKKWFVIHNILSEAFCRFCSCALVSNNNHQISFRLKMVLAYAISIVKRIFFIFLLKNSVCFSSRTSNYWCSITIQWKFQKFWTSGKPASKLPTLSMFCLFCNHFHYGKNENRTFLKPMTRIKLFPTYVGMTNSFALNHAKSLLIFFFYEQ